MSYSVIRSHEICAGHRVVGHESKCRHLHGHNYVFHFKVQPKGVPVEMDYPEGFPGPLTNPGGLDQVGRVVDFSVVKSTLCQWLEDNWDHKFLHWVSDPLINGLVDGVQMAENADRKCLTDKDTKDFVKSLVQLPFNPTAENLAAYMVNVVGPQLLAEHGVELVSCTIEETSKCHVEYTK